MVFCKCGVFPTSRPTAAPQHTQTDNLGGQLSSRALAVAALPRLLLANFHNSHALDLRLCNTLPRDILPDNT